MGALRLIPLPPYPFDMTSHWINYEGTWQITKNQGPGIKASASCERAQSVTLHRLESDAVEGGIRRLLFSADCGCQVLHDLLLSHEAYGFPGCAVTLYAGMALGAARHVWSESQSKLHSMRIVALQLVEQLQFDSKTSNTIQLALVQDLGEENTLQVIISKDGVDYARCKVERESSQQWASELEKVAYLFESRMALLDYNAVLGMAVKDSQSTIYTTLMSEVGIDESNQCLEEVVLNQNSLEGKARMKSKQREAGHTISPSFFNSMLQLPFLLLNKSTASPLNMVYVCQGWGRNRIARDVIAGLCYEMYARTRSPDPLGQVLYDVHVFDSPGHIVAVVEDLEFKAVEPGTTSSAYPKAIDPSPMASGSGLQRTGGPVSTPDSLLFKQVTQPPIPQPACSSGGETFSRVLNLIASEIGLDPQVITDDSLLIDLGIDSLMQISIVGKLRENVSGDLPSSLLMQCDRVSNLRDYFVGRS